MVSDNAIFWEKRSIGNFNSRCCVHCIYRPCSCNKYRRKLPSCFDFTLLRHHYICLLEPCCKPSIIHVLIKVSAENCLLTVSLPFNNLFYQLFEKDRPRRSKVAFCLKISCLLFCRCIALAILTWLTWVIKKLLLLFLSPCFPLTARSIVQVQSDQRHCLLHVLLYAQSSSLLSPLFDPAPRL